MRSIKVRIIALVVLTIITGTIIFFRNRIDSGIVSPKLNGNAPVINSVATNTPDTTIGISAEGSGGYKIEQVPIQASRLLPQPIPIIVRPVLYPASFNAEVKKVYAENIQEIQAGLSSNLGDYDQWISLGIYRKIANDFDGAREAWEYAKLLNPREKVAYIDLGELYHYYLKKYEASEANWRQVVKIAPESAEGYRGLHELYRYSYKAKQDMADDILIEGLRRIPNDYNLMITLAGYYKDTGNLAGARIYYEKARATEGSPL